MKGAFVKKAFSFILFCTITSGSLTAQCFIRKDIIASASVGFPHLHKLTATLITRTYAFQKTFKGDVAIGRVRGQNPISLKYEYALTKRLGLGLSASWWSVLFTVNDFYDTGTGANVRHQTDTYGLKISSVSFGVRPNYHFPLKGNKSDLFIGCAIGISRNNVALTFSSTQTNGIFSGSFADFNLPTTMYFAPTLGYRYYMTNNVGLNFELGYEKGALAQAGILFRFRPYKYEPPK